MYFIKKYLRNMEQENVEHDIEGSPGSSSSSGQYVTKDENKEKVKSYNFYNE